MTDMETEPSFDVAGAGHDVLVGFPKDARAKSARAG
jgi:hypothetical protein